MKKYLFLAISSTLFLGLSMPAFASVSYTRTPSGTEITSPVSVSVNVDDITDLFPDTEEVLNYWTFDIWSDDGEGNVVDFWSDLCMSSTTLSAFETWDLPIGFEAVVVSAEGFTTYEHCINAPTTFPAGSVNQYYFEDAGPFPFEPIFTIISGTNSGSPFNFGQGNGEGLAVASSSDLLANVGYLFSDLWPMLALFIGIPLAFYIIQRAIMTTGANMRIKK